MKKVFFLLTVSLLFSCKQNVSVSRLEVSLNGDWQFRRSGSSSWMKATVPGCVHTDLRANDSIPDPYLNDNELKLQWIDKIDWEYQKVFDVPQEILDRKNILLSFDGLDTYAEVYLNDSLLFSSDNMYCNWQSVCGQKLKKSGNVLFIKFHSPIKEGLKRLQASPYALPAVNDHSENGGLGKKLISPFLRKAPYQFGWDWGPRFATSGVWRPVSLIGWDKAQIEDLNIVQKNATDAKAEFVASVLVNSSGENESEVVIKDTVSGKILARKSSTLADGSNHIEMPFSIDNPKLWWPNGMGEHPLYGIRAEVVIAGKSVDLLQRNIGIRTIKLIQKGDKIGSSFYFEVNGVPVFMRGANYIPISIFPSEVTDSAYENVVMRAADANMNMIRVWGGGIYEKDIFYDLCDRNGILIWQDFMFACAMYPGDEAFKTNIKKEIQQNVTRLRNHPSIALWCGNNELENGWAYYLSEGMNYSKEQKEKVWNDYLSIFHDMFPKLLSALDPYRPYQPTSAYPGKGIYEKTPVDKLLDVEWRSGDWHNYWVWGAKKPFSLYDESPGRFMSEWGFQAFPEMQTVRTFAPANELKLGSPTLQLHQKSGSGNELIVYNINEHYKKPKNFEMFVYLSNLVQADAMRIATESYRRHKPFCMGTLYWQLNDVWPVVSWSTVDFYNRWKASHYTIIKCYKNVIVSSVQEHDSLKVYVVSDSLKPLNAALKLSWQDLNGKVIDEKSKDIEVKANASECFYAFSLKDLKTDASRTYCQITLSEKNKIIAEKIHYFAEPKNLLLEKPGLKISVENNTIQLSTDKLVKNLYLSNKGGDNAFSENFFDLLPGQSKTIIYKGKGKIEVGNISVISLVDSY